MNVTDETINQQQRVPWICKECWEYLRDDEPGDTCRHCKAIATLKPSTRLMLSALKISQWVLWLIVIGGSVSVLCDIFLWRP